MQLIQMKCPIDKLAKCFIKAIQNSLKSYKSYKNEKRLENKVSMRSRNIFYYYEKWILRKVY